MHNLYPNRYESAQEITISEKRRRSHHFDVQIGLAIRFYRKSAKMTLQGLAQRLGIAYQQVQKYEKGTNRVGAGRLLEIAEILDIPIALFFETSCGSLENGALAAKGLTAADMETTLQERQLLKSFLRIKDSGKRNMALYYVRSLVEAEAAPNDHRRATVGV